jgi:hypothetical protein
MCSVKNLQKRIEAINGSSQGLSIGRLKAVKFMKESRGRDISNRGLQLGYSLKGFVKVGGPSSGPPSERGGAAEIVLKVRREGATIH